MFELVNLLRKCNLNFHLLNTAVAFQKKKKKVKIVETDMNE